MNHLKELSAGWERRDVSDEEYVGALRAELKRLEELVLRADDEISEQDYELGTCNGCDKETAYSDVTHLQDCILIALKAEAERIRGEKKR